MIKTAFLILQRNIVMHYMHQSHYAACLMSVLCCGRSLLHVKPYRKSHVKKIFQNVAITWQLRDLHGNCGVHVANYGIYVTAFNTCNEHGIISLYETIQGIEIHDGRRSKQNSTYP